MKSIQCEVITPSEMSDKNKFCNRCRSYGYKTANSKKCQYYRPRNPRKKSDFRTSLCAGKKPIVMKELEDDGEEQALLDELSFDMVGDLATGLLSKDVDEDEVANQSDSDSDYE